MTIQERQSILFWLKEVQSNLNSAHFWLAKDAAGDASALPFCRTMLNAADIKLSSARSRVGEVLTAERIATKERIEA